MRLDPTVQTAIIDLTRAVARAEILPRFRSLSPDDISAKSGFQDLVTIADQRSEAALTEGLARILPEARIIGEEGVAADPSLLADLDASPLTLLIDPIDGTWNYAHGISTFGVILAALHHGEIIFGLLYDPVRDDWVVAGKDQGAWFGAPDTAPRRLTVRRSGPPDRWTGMMTLAQFSPAQRRRLLDMQDDFSRACGLRCSCHDYRQLAMGQADFISNAKLMPWDHAAGVLAVQEAGGVAALADGSLYAPRLTKGRLLAATDEAVFSRVSGAFQAALSASR